MNNRPTYYVYTETIIDDDDGTVYGELDKYVSCVRKGEPIEVLINGAWTTGYYYDEILPHNGNHWISNTPTIEISFTIDKDSIRIPIKK